MDHLLSGFLVSSRSACSSVMDSTILIDLTQRCLSAPGSECDSTSEAVEQDGTPKSRTALNSMATTSLLRVWAKATLTCGSWKDALGAAVAVSVLFHSGTPHNLNTSVLQFEHPKSTIYRIIYECLKEMDRITDTKECLHQMANELPDQTNSDDDWVEWAAGTQFCMLC